MTNSPSSACLLGALVADAASLGLHWIYDVDRIKTVAQHHGDSAAFVPLNADNFAYVPAFFAHGARSDGMLTQYGESLLLAIQSMNASNGLFDREAYQSDFKSFFGPGGQYQGYIDRPTQGTLDNLAAGQNAPSGIDDDQLPAVARVPAIIAALGASNSDALKTAVEITNVNKDATAYAAVFADLLGRVIAGDPLHSALEESANLAADPIQSLLRDAINSSNNDSIVYGEQTERACHLPMGMPLAYHIMAHTQSYAEAVDVNIKAGGDSAGRSIVIGAVLGAAHGINTPKGIPLAWVLKIQNAAELWDACQTLAK
ncbi:ADP-ribosylglycohydrolase family protein [Cochlodiniinecator piscidefendens]|uniref:ADP-ribosylglycohydrolase family protein n=1 Tax=Cochlodiniinecator piscidefendens TaxID=2715756 RepID=UPI00140D0341|nr:ADP-ribosylglycohydrolase family protein [Cochlodiniinecator piscidefendens]